MLQAILDGLISLWSPEQYKYRHSSFYCPLQILCFVFFLHMENLWPPFVKQVRCCHFSSDVCLLWVSVKHFVHSHNISDFFIIVMVFFDL